jgi:hypothetical protein
MILNKFIMWLKKSTKSSKQEDKVIKNKEEITRWTHYTLDKTNWGINKLNIRDND